MPIRKHLTDQTSFGPAAIEAMSKAFEEACNALQVFAGDEKGREIIATRIIDLARGGLVDAAALRDRVVAEARMSEQVAEMIGARHLHHICFPAAVAVSQAFIAVVAGVAVAFALWS